MGKKLLLVLSLLGLVASTAIAQPANAWSKTGYRWFSDQSAAPCASPLPLGGWTGPCYVRFIYTGTVTALGWDGAYRGGAYDWNYNFPDPDRGNNQDFAYEDYTYNGGLGVASGVTMDAADLGPPNAGGSIVLGQATWYGGGLYADSSFNSISKATVQINTNQYLTSTSQNGTCGRPRWAVNAPTACQYSMEQAVAHEMGHALGLAHPVAGPVAAGGPVLACYQALGALNRPGSDDGNGQRYLYGGYNGSRWGNPASSPC